VLSNIFGLPGKCQIAAGIFDQIMTFDSFCEIRHLFSFDESYDFVFQGNIKKKTQLLDPAILTTKINISFVETRHKSEIK
jgi:hypothetical protein